MSAPGNISASFRRNAGGVGDSKSLVPLREAGGRDDERRSSNMIGECVARPERDAERVCIGTQRVGRIVIDGDDRVAATGQSACDSAVRNAHADEERRRRRGKHLVKGGGCHQAVIPRLIASA